MEISINRELRNLDPKWVYYYIHNPEKWICTLTDTGYDEWPEVNWDRMREVWRTPFEMDCSGRSTAKTYDHLLVALAKHGLIPGWITVFLALDKDKGVEILDDKVESFMMNYPKLNGLIAVSQNAKYPRVIHGSFGAKIPFYHGGMLKTFTPGFRQKSKKVLSTRCNYLLFNEWTSFPAEHMHTIEDTIEPIATQDNPYHRATVKFWRATEKSLGRPLGKMTNEWMREINDGKKDYVPRKYLHNHTPDKSFKDMRDRFYRNFKKAFLFDYSDGVDDELLQFKPIESVSDIIAFFSDYVDGDPVYSNRIVYDGSAQRPSDASHEPAENFMQRSEEGHPHYGYYSCHVDDIPEEFHYQIVDPRMVNKARKNMLAEDFDRVYGGIWTEGIAHKPFDPADIRKCRHTDIQLKTEADNGAVNILTIDPAQGTMRMHKGMGNRNLRGKGDDGAGCVVEISDGTPDKPHGITYIYVAEDVRKEQMAIDIQHLNRAFDPLMIGMDYGGGGSAITEELAKRYLEVDGQMESFVPIVPMDSLITDTDVQRKLVFMSRSSDYISDAYRKSKKMSPFKSEDSFRNAMISTAQTMIQEQRIAFPSEKTPRQLAGQHNRGEISMDQMISHGNLEEALEQLSKITYETDKETGDRKKNKDGQFVYKFPRRKDMAMVIIYAIFLADVWMKWKTLTKKRGTGYPTAVG